MLCVGDAHVAIDHFQQAIRLNPMAPQHSHLLTGLGYAYLISGRLDEALSILKQALLEAPEWTATLVATVHCLARLERWEEARAACAQLLRHVPYMRISDFRVMTPFVDPTFVQVAYGDAGSGWHSAVTSTEDAGSHKISRH